MYALYLSLSVVSRQLTAGVLGSHRPRPISTAVGRRNTLACRVHSKHCCIHQ